jgi:hypothetical protein
LENGNGTETMPHRRHQFRTCDVNPKSSFIKQKCQ